MARTQTVSRVDLHLHTTCSDGTITPQHLVAECARLGMRVVAITDHDITDAVRLALPLARQAGLTLVPAVEINTDYGASEVHILGYWIELDHAGLQAELARIRDARLERNRQIIARLAQVGCHISEQRVRAIAGHGSLGRPHLAAAIVEAGCARDLPEAFDRFIGRRGVAYVERYRITPQEAVCHVLAAGGLPVLAHPGNIGRDELVAELVPVGLAGIEAYHSDHSSADAARYVALAQRLGLLVTGGTDSHGPAGPGPLVAIGGVPVPDWVGEAMLAARPHDRAQEG